MKIKILGEFQLSKISILTLLFGMPQIFNFILYYKVCFIIM